MNVSSFVDMVPSLPPGGAVAILLSLIPFLLPGIAGALAADASDPMVRVPPVTYRSAFDGYERWRENGKVNWREANERVGRMGGHTGHMEETPPSPGGQPSGPLATAPQAGGQHQQHKP